MKVESLQSKKVITAALFVLLLSAMDMTGAWAQDIVINGLRYHFYSDNTAAVVGHQFSQDEASGSISIPSRVYYNGNYYTVTRVGGFNGYSRLTGQINIPNTVTTISNFAFSGCTGFTGLHLSTSLTSIGISAFWGCTGLSGTLTIPESVTDMDVGAFAGTKFHTVNWNATCCNDYPTGNYYSGGYYNYNGIKYGLFEACSNLHIVNIGSGVQRIPSLTFYGCSHITTITSQAEMPPSVGTNVFNGVNTNIDVRVPCGRASVYQAASGWNVFSIMESYECEYLITGLADPAYAGSVSGSGTYNNGTTCTLTAIPNPGYYFVVWTENGSQVSTDATYTFTASQDRLLVAHFQQQLYSINVSFFPSAGGTVTGGGTFSYGNSCTVTAAANPGFLFVNWTENGNQVSTDEVYTFNVMESRDLVANFVLENIGPEQIVFADANVKTVCVENWDTNGDGELSYAEAAAVTTIGTKFESDTTITSFDEFQYFTGVTILYGGTKSVNIPPITIQYGAFFYCTNLTSIILPNSISEIRDYVFQGCSELTSLTVYAETPPTLGTGVFYNVNKAIPVYVPCTTMNAYQNASGWNEFVNYQGIDCIYHEITVSVNPTEGGTVNGVGSYIQGTNCTLMAVANTGYAFTNWTENGIVVSTSATYTFSVTEERTLLANFDPINPDDIITFADANVKAICVTNWDINGDGELSYDEAATVTDLGNVFQQNETIISFDELQYFTGLTTIHGHYSFVPIGNNTMQERPFGAFTNCHNLTSVIIPNTVTSLYCAFNGCDGLSSIVIPNSVVSIGRGTFFRCYNLTSIEIPNSVSLIDKDAFYQCTSLVTLDMGSSIVTIGNKAFYGCSHLASLIVRAVTPPALGIDVFYDVVKTIPVNVYTSTIPIYQAASGWDEFTNYQGMTGQNYEITVTANPTDDGIVTGGGTYEHGESCTVTATPNMGYSFSNWTENGIQVSTNATYTFSVITSRALVANFNPTNFNSIITFADSTVKALCVTNWDTDGDGELSYNEAAVVTDLNYVFQNKQTITSFDELQYFTGLTEIKGYAKTLTLPNHQHLTISYGDFKGCTNLTSIIIPNSVVEINSYAFSGCQSLVSLEIPGMITSIGTQTFSNCIGLTSITVYAEIPPTLGSFAFVGVDKSIPLYVPVGKVNIYQGASGWSEFTNIQEIPIPIYVIMATANPTDGGIVTGSGTYSYGASCTLTVAANESYTFVNWTENGNPVSTDTAYTFIVTAERSLVANFNNNGHEITATANPTEGGMIDGVGYYNEGGSCTLIAIANNGYSFVNWTENGNEVSTNVTYTFTVMEDRALVANFSMNSYEIIATSNPTEGGEIVGTGNYYDGTSCALAATANEGYTFVSWTENGNEVSANATYTFTVTADRTLEANFSINSYEICVSANPTIGGEVTGSGTYTFGTSCTITATANEGYTFINWTENGNHVSTDAVYNFGVTGARTLVANFCLNIYAITASAIPMEGGIVTEGGIYTHGASCTLTATANEGYNFINWTKDGEEVSTEAVYSFTVTEDAAFVANFEAIPVTQTIELSQGWNWFSTNVEITLDDLENALVEALPSTTVTIKSQTQNVKYQNGRWAGQLTALDLTRMCMISVENDCEISLVGMPINLSGLTTTINNGVNWLAFPYSESMTITNFFGSFPVNNDMVKSQSQNARYQGNRWGGQLGTLVPGKGYLYISNTPRSRTFTFPASAK